MYDWLLFLHVLAVFMFGANVVILAGFTLGLPSWPGSLNAARALGGIGGAGALVFGIWLALYVDGYALWDGWILASIVLFVATMGMTDRIAAGITPEGGARQVLAANWVRTALFVVVLMLMIFKPGA